jgi:hypothetical protein
MAQYEPVICLRDQPGSLRHSNTTGKSTKSLSSCYLIARWIRLAVSFHDLDDKHVRGPAMPLNFVRSSAGTEV